MGLADNRIPAEQLPQCWQDDVRMNALFAPFRLKTSNPESWEMKMKFWSDMLKLWCRHRKDPIVSAADAKVAFQRKGRTPACLDIVVEECFRNGELAPISKYQQILHNGPEGWVRWGARLALKPAALAITAVTFWMPGKQAVDNDGLPRASIDATQRFVLESAVEEQATALLEEFPAEAERIGTVDELMAGCEWSRSRETFEVLLGWLASRGCAVKKGDVIKLADSASTKVAPVSELDAAVARLLSAERRLSRDSEQLSRDTERAAADAAAALRLGNRLAAKNHLRRKHKLAERAQKCDGALENVRQLLHTVRETETNAAVVDTYRMSTQAMRRNMKEEGLDEDSVHNTMDDLTEVLETYSEVEKALSRATDDVDAAELEAELKALLAEPGPPAGGSPGGSEKTRGEPVPASALPTPPSGAPRKISERDFVFDGEEQMLLDLNELGVGDASPRGKAAVERPKAKPVALADGWSEADKCKATSDANSSERWSSTPKAAQQWASPEPKPAQQWYPQNVDFSPGGSALDQLCDSFSELRTDQRLHPGQRLQVDGRAPPSGLYGGDFQVRDHSREDGVWLFNRTDSTPSTDYDSPSSPGKYAPTSFQMAPGGERASPASPWQPASPDTDDLQARLNNLRGLNL